MSSSDCGEGKWKRSFKCTSDPDHPIFTLTGKSCGAPGCPVCWPTWCKRGSDRIADRVYAFRELRPSAGYARHIVFSLDIAPNAYSAQSLQDQIPAWRSQIRKMALEAGVQAGALIFHLYRLNLDGRREYQDYYAAGGTKKVWEWVRSRPDWRDLVAISPHGHVIGYGWLAAPAPGKGFVYKNVRSLNARDEIEKTAFYCLSHAPLTKGHAVTYFGQLSYNKMKRIDQVVEWVRLTCPVCGAKMIAIWHTDGQEQEPYVKQIRGVYELKPDG